MSLQCPGQPLRPPPGPNRTHRQAIRRCGRCKPCPRPHHCLTAQTDGGPPPSTTSAGSTPRRRSTSSDRSLCTLSSSTSTPLPAVIVPLQARFPAIDPIHFRDIPENCFRPENIIKLSTTFVQTACRQEVTTLGSHSIPTGERDRIIGPQVLPWPHTTFRRLPTLGCSLAHGRLLPTFDFPQPSCKRPS